MREIFNTTTIMTIGTTKAYTLSAMTEKPADPVVGMLFYTVVHPTDQPTLGF
jgi:hypothetical protein